MNDTNPQRATAALIILHERYFRRNVAQGVRLQQALEKRLKDAPTTEEWQTFRREGTERLARMQQQSKKERRSDE
jgi:hypothetical protein